jgi:hypothetical protein
MELPEMKAKPGRRIVLSTTIKFDADEYAAIRELAHQNGISFHDQVYRLCMMSLDIERAIEQQAMRAAVTNGVKNGEESRP